MRPARRLVIPIQWHGSATDSPAHPDSPCCADSGGANLIPHLFDDADDLLLHANLLLFESIARMSGDNMLCQQNRAFCPLTTDRRII